MYQVVVSYLDCRYGCFFCEEAILDYADLLEKVKTAVPYIKNIPTERIRIAYKDVSLSKSASTGQGEGVFINIFPGNPMVLEEAFRNAYDCGAESFKRIEIKLREVDSPCVAKTRKQNTTSTTGSTTDSRQTNMAEQHAPARKSKELFPEQDWKTNKLEEMSGHTQELQDELYAVNVQLEDLKRPVIEPPQLGQYKSIVCGKCHIRGHRAEGNRHNAACMREACTSYYTCGQNKKHPEHFEQIRNLTKRQKQLNSEIETLSTDKRSLEAFQSKSVSTFVTTMTPRLLKAFPDRYTTKTTSGKISLQKDLATLRIACNNEIPDHSMDERQYFTELLEKQQKQFIPIDTFDARTSTSQPNILINTHVSSPVKTAASKKAKHRKKIKVEISSSDDSSSSSDTTCDDSESSDEERRSKSRRSKKYRRKYKGRDKWSKKKRYNRLPSVRNECIGNKNIEICNNVQENCHNRRVSPYLTYLQGGVPSDSGLFDETNFNQQEHPTNKDERPEPDLWRRQTVVTEQNTLSLADLANAAEDMDKLPG